MVGHEQGASFMAEMYGRVTGKAGVCAATIGPGAMKLLLEPRMLLPIAVHWLPSAVAANSKRCQNAENRLRQSSGHFN